MSKYCDVLKTTTLDLGSGEQARAEKIKLKANNVEEIRFSWRTQDGAKFVPRPLDLPEKQWVELFDQAIKDDVVSQDFIKDMIKVLSQGLK
jgi:hypothetical protein